MGLLNNSLLVAVSTILDLFILNADLKRSVTFGPDEIIKSYLSFKNGRSINTTTTSIVKYVSQKAGIGIGAGKIRAIGSPIRNGDATHTGVIPFYKLFQSAVKSCSQGGVRGGAATLYYPIWHAEIEDMLVLKNNKGTEENRVRHMDYGVQFNKLMYERLLDGKNITLFSPHDVPGLYDAFYADQEAFQELYEKAEIGRASCRERV